MKKVLISLLFIGAFLTGCAFLEWQIELFKCGKIDHELEKNDCYTFVAGQKRDINVCEKIKDERGKTYCYIEVVAKKEKAGDKENNFAICDKMSNQTYKDMCYSSIGGARRDLSICEKLSQPHKDVCFKSIGISTKNATLCEKVESEMYRNQCYEFTDKDENTKNKAKITRPTTNDDT